MEIKIALLYPACSIFAAYMTEVVLVLLYPFSPLWKIHPFFLPSLWLLIKLLLTENSWICFSLKFYPHLTANKCSKFNHLPASPALSCCRKHLLIVSNSRKLAERNQFADNQSNAIIKLVSKNQNQKESQFWVNWDSDQTLFSRQRRAWNLHCMAAEVKSLVTETELLLVFISVRMCWRCTLSLKYRRTF